MFHGYVGFKNDKDFTTEGFFTKMGASTGSVGINGLRYSILCCGIGIPLCEYLVSLCGFPFHYVVFRFRMNDAPPNPAVYAIRYQLQEPSTICVMESYVHNVYTL